MTVCGRTRVAENRKCMHHRGRAALPGRVKARGTSAGFSPRDTHNQWAGSRETIFPASGRGGAFFLTSLFIELIDPAVTKAVRLRFRALSSQSATIPHLKIRIATALPFKQFFASGHCKMPRRLTISLRVLQDSLIVEGFQVFRARREHLPLSRVAEELCKVDKSFSGN